MWRRSPCFSVGLHTLSSALHRFCLGAGALGYRAGDPTRGGTGARGCVHVRQGTRGRPGRSPITGCGVALWAEEQVGHEAREEGGGEGRRSAPFRSESSEAVEAAKATSHPPAGRAGWISAVRILSSSYVLSAFNRRATAYATAWCAARARALSADGWRQPCQSPEVQGFRQTTEAGRAR